jgi:membrane protease YdiL (CAAX protease family)
LGIAAAELVTVLINPIAGLAFHLVLLSLLVFHSSLAGPPHWFPHPMYKFYFALSLAPLIRILSLFMLLVDMPRIYLYATIAVPLMAAAFLAIWRLGFSLGEVGIVRSDIPFQLLIGTFTGFIFGLAGHYILEPPELLVGGLEVNQTLLLAIILLMATGFAEELTFRGVMQRCATEAMGRRGWVYVAFVFAILQIGYLSVFHFLFALAMGLFYGYAAFKGGSILGVSLSHGITNITLCLVGHFLY